jgi:hypothetical protein
MLRATALGLARVGEGEMGIPTPEPTRPRPGSPPEPMQHRCGWAGTARYGPGRIPLPAESGRPRGRQLPARRPIMGRRRWERPPRPPLGQSKPRPSRLGGVHDAAPSSRPPRPCSTPGRRRLRQRRHRRHAERSCGRSSHRAGGERFGGRRDRDLDALLCQAGKEPADGVRSPTHRLGDLRSAGSFVPAQHGADLRLHWASRGGSLRAADIPHGLRSFIRCGPVAPAPTMRIVGEKGIPGQDAAMRFAFLHCLPNSKFSNLQSGGRSGLNGCKWTYARRMIGGRPPAVLANRLGPLRSGYQFERDL